MGTVEIIQVITLVAVVIGAILNVSNMVGKAENKAAANAEIKVKLDNIATTMSTMATKQTDIDNTLKDHDRRITRTEESLKSAHHRLNKLDGVKSEEKEDTE